MGNSKSKKKISSDEPSGSQSSAPQKTIYERIMMKGGPKPEEILISELVSNIPKHLNIVNNDKKKYVDFYQDIWLSERECLLGNLQDLHDERITHERLTNSFTKMLLISAACKVLTVLFIIFLVQTILFIVILASLVVDGSVVYLYNECKLKRDKIKKLVPAFHRDISNTAMLKSRWHNARKSFKMMKSEVARFIFDAKNIGYEIDDPVVQRFLSNAKVRNIEESRDLGLFFMQDFLELICDYNASLKFFKICKNDAYHEYYDKCHKMQESIMKFGEDVGLYFKDMEFTDLTLLSMEIVSGDLEVVGKKIKSALEIVMKETESLNSSVEKTKNNMKKRL